MRTNVTLYLDPDEFRSLQNMAADRGFVQSTGFAAGRFPNVSGMVRAIAAGKLALVGPAPSPAECIEALDLALKLVRRPALHDVLVLMRADMVAAARVRVPGDGYEVSE